MNEEFDHIANEYDLTFTNTKVGAAQRQIVFNLLDNIQEEWSDLSILELNGGTGEDAIYFAKKNARVLTTDISSEMLGLAQEKTKQFDSVLCQKLDIREAHKLDKQFDFVFSNFGGLNCLSNQEFKKFIQDSHKIIKPSGKLVMVVMPRFCAWETIYFLSKFKLRSAFRRRNRKGVLANVSGKEVKTYYFSPGFIKKHKSKYKVSKIAPIGLFVPPSYLNSWSLRNSKTFNRFFRWDLKLLKYSYLANMSDHFFICLEKE